VLFRSDAGVEHAADFGLPRVAAEGARDEAPRIALAEERGEVIHAALRDGGGKAMIVPDNPRGHVTAVGAAGDDFALWVNVAFFGGDVGCRENVAGGPDAPVLVIGVLKLVAVATGAARIRKHNRVALYREILKLEPHAVLARAPHRRRPAVDLEEERIFFRGVKRGRLHRPELDIVPVAVCERVRFVGAEFL